MKIDTILSKLGFDNNQVSVYLAILSLGTATASDIARKSGIVRTYIYKIIESFIDSGLVEETHEKVKKFTALHPTKLIDLMENKKNLAESLLPELLGMFSTKEFKPKMKFYEGKNAKKKVFEDIFNFPESTIYTFSPLDDLLSQFGKTYMRHYMERRVQNKIKRLSLRPFLEKNNSETWDSGTGEKFFREVKILPENIDCDTIIQIYADKIGIIASEKEDYAFIIESKELYGFMKQIFLFLWSTAKK
ncbi:MAG: helix-turn-helix domain-containing protein [Patescibacteria group bacterium]|nr:helix-turn-helix domain-containing protein [Patescibacteria group bacterium]